VRKIVKGEGESISKQTVPEKSGWYIWVKLTKDDFDRIYIGKSEIGKTAHLRKRIEDELIKEKMFLWPELNKKIHLRELSKAHPNRENMLQGHLDRALLKKGTTHIIWITKGVLITNKEIEKVEYGLISKFDPYANIKGNNSKFAKGFKEIVAKVKDEFKELCPETA
jgi:hypothetical protein